MKKKQKKDRNTKVINNLIRKKIYVYKIERKTKRKPYVSFALKTFREDAF